MFININNCIGLGWGVVDCCDIELYIYLFDCVVVVIILFIGVMEVLKKKGSFLDNLKVILKFL